LALEGIMARQATMARKFVVRLSAEERGRLDEIISKGKHSAQLMMKARITASPRREVGTSTS